MIVDDDFGHGRELIGVGGGFELVACGCTMEVPDTARLLSPKFKAP